MQHAPHTTPSMDDGANGHDCSPKTKSGGATSLISTESSITTGEAEPQYELAEYSEPS
jgi:hypothetical protein